VSSQAGRHTGRSRLRPALPTGSDGGFITRSDIHPDGGVTAASCYRVGITMTLSQHTPQPTTVLVVGAPDRSAGTLSSPRSARACGSARSCGTRHEGCAGSREKSRKTTLADGPETPRPADLVDRKFLAAAPSQLWVADLTYVRTHSGWGLRSARPGRVLPHGRELAVSTSLRTDLVLDALDMGLWARQRAGQDVNGLKHPSGRGSVYTSWVFGHRLRQAALARQGAGRVEPLDVTVDTGEPSA
jgi:transposase InsO family protein